jgi:hypothetical protein
MAPASVKSPLTGRWHLVETDLWSEDSIDLLEQAHIEFGSDGIGYMIVGALQADVDWRIGERDGHAVVEFSWLGDDDGHPSSGRGWACLDADRQLHVKLYIHRGDEVAMVGVPMTPAPNGSSPTSKRARRGARRSRR